MMAISDDIRATYMESWPDELLDLSIPGAEIELSSDDLFAIGSSSPSFRGQFSLPRIRPLSASLLENIESALAEFTCGVFPRLGTCSFKQASSANRPLTTVEAVASEITSVNERVAAAIKNALRDNYPQSLFLREWRYIPPWSEFRVFVRSGKICGISQYHHRQIFREIETHVPDIIKALIPAIRDVIAACTLSDFVADFYVLKQTTMHPKLIEINPFHEKTNPALYSWNRNGDFDGHLRYRNRSGHLMSADIRSVLTSG